MSYEFTGAKVLAATKFPGREVTVVSFAVKCPRFIWPQVLMYRACARNSNSSRAIPSRILLERVQNTPVIPMAWLKNQKGMQPAGPIDDPQAATDSWLRTRDAVMAGVQELVDLGVAKESANRLLEPFMYQEGIMTFQLGRDADPRYLSLPYLLHQRQVAHGAQGEFADLASKMAVALREATVVESRLHTPLSDDQTPMPAPVISWQAIARRAVQSVARAARISYGKTDPRSDEEEGGTFEKMAEAKPPHASAFEHVWFDEGSGPQSLREGMCMDRGTPMDLEVGQ